MCIIIHSAYVHAWSAEVIKTLPDTLQLSSSGPVLVCFLCIQATMQAGWGDI